MNRQSWLAALATGGTTAVTLLAGCSAITGGDSDDTDAGSDSSNNGFTADGNSGNEIDTENRIGDGVTTPEMATNEATASDQALDTGQAPPSETGTPFEDTVPEEEGLETEQGTQRDRRGMTLLLLARARRVDALALVVGQ